MTEKAPFDLDVALAALGRDERVAQPALSESLQARVLGDAALVAGSGRFGSTAQTVRRPAPEDGRSRLFGLFDAWSGAAVATALACLLIGLSVGYEAGPAMMEQAGLDGAELALAVEDGDDAFLWGDVL